MKILKLQVSKIAKKFQTEIYYQLTFHLVSTQKDSHDASEELQPRSK